VSELRHHRHDEEAVTPVRLLQSSLSPVESQARADVWLRVGNCGMMAVVGIVAYTLRTTSPVASTWLWLAVAGFLVLLLSDIGARHLPSK
jgi:hypothetical protein